MKLLMMAWESEWNDNFEAALEEQSVQLTREWPGDLRGKQGEMLFARWSGELAADGEYDAVVLCLAQNEGLLEYLPGLRKACALPVVVTGSAAENSYFEELNCLEQGADDYFRTSMSVPIMIVRIQRLIQLYHGMKEAASYQAGLAELPEQEDYAWGGCRLGLTGTEYRVLHLLLHSREGVVTREKLLARVWRGDDASNDWVLTAMVRKLRKKLAATPIRIVSSYGKGYCIRIRKED